MSPATISHHLDRLSRARLVTAYLKSHFHYYRVQLKVLSDLSKALFAIDKPAPPEGLEGYSAFERKVLRDFVAGGKLKSLPSQRKKRRAVLKYVLSRFEQGKRYSEGEVNDEIRLLHDDCATIRRELIMNKLMARQDGIYWRTD